MGTYTARDRARTAIAKLAGGEPDGDAFRHEAVALLHKAIGVDGWGWLDTDPGAGLPVHDYGENVVADRALRRLFELAPEAWNEPAKTGGQGTAASAPPVATLSAATRGDLRRDLVWRELFGPAGVGDKMRAQLVDAGMCWAFLQVHRDGSSKHYGEEDAGLVADVAPLLAHRIRADLRAPVPREAAMDLEPGTLILDQDQSLVAGTEQAWRWIDRLGIRGTSETEPLPGNVYVVAAQVANSPERQPARTRVRAADGSWVVIRAASLTTGSGTPAGYAVTLEAASADDLAPLLMRAWGLTRREREVARLVIDGLSSEDIAATLFISVHTARDHLKAIYAKVGVSRRQDLAAVLSGRPPAGDCA